MKRILTVVLLLMLALLLLVGCNQKQTPDESTNEADESTNEADESTNKSDELTESVSPEKCESCTFGEWSVISVATCNSEGAKTRTCTVCGETEAAHIEKVACSFGEWATVNEPTTEAAGLKKRTCTVCGAAETEEIAKLAPVYSVSCKNGNKTTVVYADEDGNYTIAAPSRLGYDFAGWKTEAGEDFAAEGTITANVKVIAQWNVARTTTFAELKERVEAGVADVLVDADIVLTDTVYVTGKTTIYTTEDHNLTRSPSFVGDLFVLGQTADGMNSILLTGEAASLTLSTESDSALTVDGNKANMTEDAKGTAFMLLNSSTLNLYDNVTVTNCKKVGNIRLLDDDANVSKPHRAGGAAAIVADGVLNIYGATISGCEVNTVDKKNVGTDDEDYNDSCCGGAIFNRSTVNMYSGTISGSKASRGAAIFNYRTVNLKGGVIEDNYASTYAAVLYLADSQYAYAAIGEATEEIKLNIRNNESEKSGGAIFGQHQSVIQIYGGVEFNGNKSLTGNGGAINMAGALTIGGGRFVENLAASKGGAVYVYYSDPDQTVREVNITGGLFEGNEASKGGALGLGASSEEFHTGAVVNVSGATFKENIAFLTEEESPGFIDNTDRNGVTKAENGKGGAIYVFWKAKLSIGGDTNIQGNISGDYGGAIYLTSSGSTVTVNGTADAKPIFLQNEAGGNGGAIYAYSGTELSVNNAIFRENKASGEKYGGGAMYLTGATATIENSSFESNESLTKNGGAICAYSSSSLTMKDVMFTGNVAADNGGAICLNKSVLTVETTITLNQNSAGGDGGAIHIKEGSMTANTVNVSGNSATGGGGAIYLNKADDASGAATLNVTNLTATGNSAVGNGGALYLHTYSVTEIGSLVATDNTSDEYGGAIYASTGDSVTIGTVAATGNEAPKGGFLYLTTKNTVVTILGGEASDNVAPDGGATAYSNSTSAVLKLPATGFDYPANSITGKSGFAVTVIPAEVNS